MSSLSSALSFGSSTLAESFENHSARRAAQHQTSLLATRNFVAPFFQHKTSKYHPILEQAYFLVLVFCISNTSSHGKKQKEQKKIEREKERQRTCKHVVGVFIFASGYPRWPIRSGKGCLLRTLSVSAGVRRGSGIFQLQKRARSR